MAWSSNGQWRRSRRCRGRRMPRKYLEKTRVSARWATRSPLWTRAGGNRQRERHGDICMVPPREHPLWWRTFAEEWGELIPSRWHRQRGMHVPPPRAEWSYERETPRNAQRRKAPWNSVKREALRNAEIRETPRNVETVNAGRQTPRKAARARIRLPTY